jgi:hypothetical protein
MATKEDEFKERFVAILSNARHGLVKDREAMMDVGEMASRIVANSGAKTWRMFKSRLTQDVYSAVLRQLEFDGNALNSQGRVKKAYAAQLLATSLVASTQKDKQVREGTKLLDDLVDITVRQYNETRNVQPVLNRPLG